MIINPRFFIGTVVATEEETSRVRVSIYGEHDELIEEDQAQLPWSIVMFSNTGAGLPGDGVSLGLKKDSTVFGLYVNESHTIILGCIQATSVAGRKPNALELSQTADGYEGRMIKEHGEGLGKIKIRERNDTNEWTPKKQAYWDNEYNEYYKNHPDEDPGKK